MTCRHTQSLLEDFLDGQLSASNQEVFARHLDSCHECRRKVDDARALKEDLEKLSFPDPGEAYFEQTSRLILARTGVLDRMQVQSSGLLSPYETGPTEYRQAKYALLRSAASFVVALGVLASAIYIGSSNSGRNADINSGPAGYYVSVDLSELLNDDSERIVTVAEQNRISRGMLLMGAPGALGRGPLLSQMLLPIE